jgi:signal transduction histidine kinase
METERPQINGALGSRPFQGMDSLAASIGLAIAAVFLLSAALSCLWSAYRQREALESGRAQRLATVGNLLAQNAESLLAANEISAVRRIVAEAANAHGLSQCRIVLPGGQVVADSIPSQITVRDLPASWPGAASQSALQMSGDRALAQTFPLSIAGRGSASLEIKASAGPAASFDWPTQAGIGAISAAGLAALLLIRRKAAGRLGGIAAVRLALREFGGGQRTASALEVDAKLGPEAHAWNEMLREREKLREQTVREKTADSLQKRRGPAHDLDAACDAMSQGLILVGEDRKARYANGAAAILLRTTRESLLASDITRLVPDPRVAEAVQAAPAGATPRRAIIEVERGEADGGGVLRYVVRPVRREDSGVIMIVIEDITQQRVAEKARNAFVAQATHELRTPLTNIRLSLEMAMDEGSKNPEVRDANLNIINQEVRRLDRMIGDILSVAEIEAGAMKLRKDDVQIEELFRNLQADYAAQAREKQIELLFDLPPKLPVIQGDRDKIAVGLHNLVGNALKYTPAGGRVVVRVTVEQDRVVAEVIDTGIGIGAADREKIFDKFYRAADCRIAKITGSGLGLAIAREVIRLHGGDITVKSEVDKGSTFTLFLPMTREAA